MMQLTRSTKNYWLLSTCLFSFFLTWSFAFSIFPIWLNQYIGLSGERTGLIFSLNSLTALLVMPLYGIIQDKLGIKRSLLFAVGVLLILSGPFFIFVYAPLLKNYFYLGAFIGGIYFSITFLAGVGVVETYVERISRQTGFEFGKARMWGSLGWACATFFTGYLFNINPHINFYLASACAVIFMVALLFVSTAPTAGDTPHTNTTLNTRDALGLLRLPRFWAFSTYVIGVTCIYYVYDQQFPIYFSSLFPSSAEGNSMYGYLNSLQVFLEAGGMFLAPFIVNKIGAKNGLLLAGGIMACRILGSGFATTQLEISAMKLLHAAELPIMLIAIFKYISSSFDARLSSTLYLVGFQFMTQVASSGLSVVAGTLYDKLGFATSYKLMGIIVLCFLVISALILRSDRQPTPQLQPTN
ncbi:MAG: galactoside permease [Cellvibrio sp.]|nr:galactoside permease [Cellvibrio sp.]